MFEILHVDVVQELRFKIFLVTGHGVLILKFYIRLYIIKKYNFLKALLIIFVNDGSSEIFEYIFFEHSELHSLKQ